ncbi:hypothetical protein [Campylobacter rectus]|uniref:hypothetical protein n=1 Tax=Campylobacter rectus TaxID=203 RepID=UPI00163A232E|nr:hypothetical protein [Campylobacter rectus]
MSKISNKDLISKFKDYADIADASYAMLHWVNENEDDGWFDKFKERKPMEESLTLLSFFNKLTSLKI